MRDIVNLTGRKIVCIYIQYIIILVSLVRQKSIGFVRYKYNGAYSKR